MDNYKFRFIFVLSKLKNMKRIKLEPNFTTRVVEHDDNNSSLYFSKNERYIDLDNLEKYTVKDLKSICLSYGAYVSNGKKDLIIRVIKSEKIISKIIRDNREYKLKNLGI